MLDMELKHKLEELEAVTEENNAMLHEMHRAAVFHRVVTVIKWVLIVIFAMAGYYVLQPFVDSARNTYEALQSGVTEVTNAKESLPNFSSFLSLFSSQKSVSTEGETPVPNAQ